MVPAPFLLVFPCSAFLKRVLLKILSVQSRSPIKRQRKHRFIKLVNQKTSGVAGSRGSQDNTMLQTCLHTCSLSPTFSIFGVFPLLLSISGKTFSYGNILGYQQPQDYLIPDKKSIFAKSSWNSPREDLDWPNLTSSHGSLRFSLYMPCFLTLHPQLTTQSPTPTSRISLCSGSVLTNML